MHIKEPLIGYILLIKKGFKCFQELINLGLNLHKRDFTRDFDSTNTIFVNPLQSMYHVVKFIYIYRIRPFWSGYSHLVM